MTREEAIEVLNRTVAYESDFAEAHSGEVTEMVDLIRREDVIEVLMGTIAPPSVVLDTLVMRIDALPSAKTGEWILDGGSPICSVCHKEPCWSSEGYDFTEYCPNCGARMIGGDTE